ncbi:MAG: hypothetical protein ACOX1L_01735 [Erysipelotrichaceae bacterium]|jgi:hypothetical protein
MKSEDNCKKTDTNIDKIKKTLEDMIDMELVVFAEEYDMYIHPFTSSKRVVVENNGKYSKLDLTLQENFFIWKKHLVKQFAGIKQIDEVFDYIETNYFTLFILSQFYKKGIISSEDMGEMLKNKFRYLFDKEPYLVNRNDVVDIFKYADKISLMDKESLTYYQNLPANITLYRAIENKGYDQPFVWFQSQQEAISNQIFHDYNQMVEIWQLDVPRENILAVWLDEHQGNIIIVDVNEKLNRNIICKQIESK